MIWQLYKLKTKAYGPIMSSIQRIYNEDLSIEELLEIKLECPLCHAHASTHPLYRCRNGHILCNECRQTVRDCSECHIEPVDLSFAGEEALESSVIEEVLLSNFNLKLTEYEKYCKLL